MNIPQSVISRSGTEWVNFSILDALRLRNPSTTHAHDTLLVRGQSVDVIRNLNKRKRMVVKDEVMNRDEVQ